MEGRESFVKRRTPAAKWEKGDEVNRRTRAELQWIVRQAHSRTYGTRSTQSRLQRILSGWHWVVACLGHHSISREARNTGEMKLSVSHAIAETPLSSGDSDLEAFSLNPTDGSFAALPVQAAALPII